MLAYRTISHLQYLNLMEFVAQKLGFLKCNQPSNACFNIGKRPIDITADLHQESSVRKKRKLSQEDDSSSSSSLSLGKIKITDSSDSNPTECKPISIPIPIRPAMQTKSLVVIPEIPDYASLLGRFPMSHLERIPEMPFSNDFPPSEYLSFLVAPYGTPTRFIGPITQTERKEKVNRYLQKKKNRQWKIVKYAVRKQLAEGRKRVQGRFVKSQRKWRWNQILIKPMETQGNGQNVPPSESNNNI